MLNGQHVESKVLGSYKIMTSLKICETHIKPAFDTILVNTKFKAMQVKTVSECLKL